MRSYSLERRQADEGDTAPDHGAGIDLRTRAASRRAQSRDIRRHRADTPGDGGAPGDTIVQRQEAEASTEPPPLRLGGGTHTVRRGDNLWTIAEDTYGSGTLYTHIRDANPDGVHRGGRLIHPGTVLTLPVIERAMLEGLGDFADDPERQRDVAVGISDEDYAAFIAALEAEERDTHAELLQLVEMMRASGMTLDGLAADQRRWMEQQAADRGLTIGEFIRDETASRGYGGSTATWWPSLTPDEQRAWTARFHAAVRQVEAAAPEDIRAILAEATANGGGFAWEPEHCEELGAFAYNNGRHALAVGRHWLEAVERDPAVTFGNIAHELGGHQEYGDTAGWAIIGRVLEGLPEDERTLATSGSNYIFSAYGYMETEVFAELREQEHLHPDNPTDTPAEDVPRQLTTLRSAFSPTVADAIVRGLWQRVESSQHMTDEAKQLYRTHVRDVFGIDL